MLKKIIGFILLLHPLLVSYIFIRFNLEFVWYYHADFKYYDLVVDTLSFALCIYAIQLISNKKQTLTAAFLFIIFVVYQSFAMQNSTINYSFKLNIDSDRALYLVRHGTGALDSSFIKLISTKEYYLLFIKHKTIRSYDRAVQGQLDFKGKYIVIATLITDNKQKLTDEFYVRDIILED